MNRFAVIALTTAVAGFWGCEADRAADSVSGSAEESGGVRMTPQLTQGSLYPAAPYLAELERTLLDGGIWERPDLSKRDRSIITLAVTQALYEPEEFGMSLRRALDEGVSADEISEIVTHAAMYAGWPTGSMASRIATEVYQDRGVSFPEPAESVRLDIGLNGARPGYPAFPYLSALTSSFLYGDPGGVWSRPGLSPRDRSMVTVAVQQALYETQQLRGHMGRALNNGVTQDELVELITHVTFYAGWPTGSNAARVAAEVFAERGLPLGQGQ